MKSQNIIMVAILIMGFGGCICNEPSAYLGVDWYSITFSGCNTSVDQTVSEAPWVDLKGQEDNMLLITLGNTEFCCGTESVSVLSEELANTITIEVVDDGPHTYCYCAHDVEFSIGPFFYDEYRLVIIESEHAYQRDTLEISFNYSEKIDKLFIID